MKIISLLITLFITTTSVLLAKDPPIPHVENIFLGDLLSKHLESLEPAEEDSKLPDYPETYFLKKDGGVKFADVIFDLAGFGVKDGKIQQIYVWKMSYESLAHQLRNSATVYLNNTYKDFGVYVDPKLIGNLTRGKKGIIPVSAKPPRVWILPQFTIKLLSEIQGEYKPYKDRYTSVEIFASLNEEKNN